MDYFKLWKARITGYEQKKHTEGAGHPADHHGRLVVAGQVTEGDVLHLMDGMFPCWIPVEGAV